MPQAKDLQRHTGLSPEDEASASTESCPLASSKDGHNQDRALERKHLDHLAKADQLAGAGGRRGCHPKLARGLWASLQMEGTHVLLEATFSAIP